MPEQYLDLYCRSVEELINSCDSPRQLETCKGAIGTLRRPFFFTGNKTRKEEWLKKLWERYHYRMNMLLAA